MQRIKLVCPTCSGETYRLTNGTPEGERQVIAEAQEAHIKHIKSLDHGAPVVQRREDVTQEQVRPEVWAEVMGT